MIEAARLRDLNALMTMEEESFSTDKISREQMEKYVVNNGGTHFFLVARNEADTAVGCILVLIRRGSRVGRIHTYAVHSSQRGKGLGEQLIEAAAHLAKAGYDVAELRTEVRSDNPHAIKRYEKSGFRRSGGKQNYYEDGCNSFSFKRYL